MLRLSQTSLLTFLLLAGPSFADDTPATVFSSDIDFALMYVDGFTRPSAGAVHPGDDHYAIQAPVANSGERGLGLRHARASFALESLGSSKLVVVIRPDVAAHAADTAVTELDTRAGDVYRSMPEIRLLDAYQLTMRPGTGMSVGVGVWEQIAVPSLAYPQILQPGLDVFLPVKFSGLRLRWNKYQPYDPASQSQRLRGIVSDFFVIQGDRDRVESRVYNKDTDDDAPGASDPHYGAAASFQWIPSDSWSLMLTGGSLSADAAAGSAGNVSEVFAEVNAMLRLQSVMRGLTTSFQLKQSKETFRDTPAALDDRLNQSVALLISAGIVSGTSVLTGFSYGFGEWPADEAQPSDNSEFSGHQFEIGVLNEVGKDLYLQAMLAQENRTRKDPGGAEIGGFADGDSRQRSVRRLGVQLSYQMSGLR